MNIQELKKQADEDMTNKEKICALRNSAILEFERFFEVMNKSYLLWNAKKKIAVDQFCSSFKRYFVENGFDVKGQNPFGQNGPVTEMVATYKGLTFKLSNINYEHEHMYIQDFNDINEEIWIALPNDVPDYSVWKDNIVVGTKRLVDMDGPVKDIYKQFVEKFETEEEIQQLIRKININIDHFQDAINAVDSIDLCIHRFGTDDTYKNFEELIDIIG